MKKASALASVLHKTGARIPAEVVSEAEQTKPAANTDTPKLVQPSRQGTKAITVHFPEQVRRQLKSMAGEQGRPVDDMVAEALNLLFAKYRKTEIAPRKLVS